MKTHALFISLAVAVCAAAPLPGLSQERHDDRGAQQGHDNGDHRNDRGHDAHDNERGAGPRHDMRRGQRISPEYRNKQYVVDDWRGHRLSAPPRGYHWVQAGGDYVLVAVATGIIANVLLNH